MIYTHVFNRGGLGVKSPVEKMAEEMRVSYTYLNKRLCSDEPLPIRIAERVLRVRKSLA